MIKIFNFEEIINRSNSNIIDLPPSIHKYYSYFRGTPQVTKTGKEYVKYFNTLNIEKFNDKEVELYIDFYFKTNHANDIDNPLKCLCDALKKSGIIYDDENIKKITAEKFWPKDIFKLYGEKAPKFFEGGMYFEIKNYKNLRENNI